MLKRQKTIKDNFYDFDLAGKGYLTQNEYQAFCYSILIKPIIKEERIYFENIKDKEIETDLNELFSFFADSNERITYESLFNACNIVNFPKTDIKEMINFLNNEKGYLDFNDFKKIF